jgi:hypothetical protein
LAFYVKRSFEVVLTKLQRNYLQCGWFLRSFKQNYLQFCLFLRSFKAKLLAVSLCLWSQMSFFNQNYLQFGAKLLAVWWWFLSYRKSISSVSEAPGMSGTLAFFASRPRPTPSTPMPGTTTTLATK